MIEAEGISYSRRRTEILSDVSLTSHNGAVTGIIGPNGAGKSTMLSMMYKALSPDSGAVYINGEDVASFSRREIARNISVVAQKSEDTLPLSVRDSVALGLLSRVGAFSYGSADDLERVDQALHHVGLEHLADRLTHELSGGEFQRVLIARAIVQGAEHLLLDEPTNHLDIHHQHRILELVRNLNLTTTIVLHDLNLAARFCDQLILMEQGKVVARGKPEDVLTPQRVSSVYRINADVVEHDGQRYLIFIAEGGRRDRS